MSLLSKFPELADFELELQGNRGLWSSFREDEDERAAAALNDEGSMRYMLCGGETTVERDGVRTRCRLTPKSWLAKKGEAKP